MFDAIFNIGEASANAAVGTLSSSSMGCGSSLHSSLPVSSFLTSFSLENTSRKTQDLAIASDATSSSFYFIRSSPTPLETFLLFDKLPLEIRLKIWNLLFVPKDISLDFIHRIGNTSSPPGCYLADSRFIFPCTLHVNHESRTETKKHYCYLFPNEAQVDVPIPFRSRPIIINPKIDAVILPYHSDLPAYPFDQWLSYVDSRISGGFRGEGLRDFRILKLSKLRYPLDFTDDALNLMWGEPGSKAERLLKFSGIEELHVRIRIFDSEGTLSCTTAEDDCCKFIKAFLERHKDVFVGNNIPKVVVHGVKP